MEEEINLLMDDSGLLTYTVHRKDILNCDFTGIVDLIDRLSRNKESALFNRGKLEVLIDGFNDDPREAFEIPEIRRWYTKSIQEGIPWFYFLGSSMEMISFKVLLFCFCDIKIRSHNSNGPVVEITSPEKIIEWLDFNYDNLNKFTDDKGLPIEINKEMSLRASSFIKEVLQTNG